MATDSLPPHDPASSAKRWSGYTIDDLRYSRAVKPCENGNGTRAVDVKSLESHKL